MRPLQLECVAPLHGQDFALSQGSEVGWKFEIPGSRACKLPLSSSAISAPIFKDKFVHSHPKEDWPQPEV